MSIETDLIAYLNASVSLAVGVFYERADDNEPVPLIILSVENRDQDYMVGGIVRLKHITLTLDCHHDTALAACELGDRLLDLLDNYRGLIGSSTVESIQKLADSDSYEAQSGTFYRSINLTIGYR